MENQENRRWKNEAIRLLFRFDKGEQKRLESKERFEQLHKACKSHEYKREDFPFSTNR